AGRQVRRPVDLAHRGMELIRVARIETSELDEHTVGDARPEARAVDALERAEEGRAGRALAHLAHPAPLELAGEQIGKAARRAGAKSEEWRAHGAPEGISSAGPLVAITGAIRRPRQVRSRQVEPGRLELRVLLEGVQRLVASDAGLLEAAEGHGEIIGIVAVD